MIRENEIRFQVKGGPAPGAKCRSDCLQSWLQLVWLLVVLCLHGYLYPEDVWAGHSAGIVFVQAEGGAYIGTDERSSDTVIRIGPPAEAQGAGIYMDRNPGTGDRVFHVVPPLAKEQHQGLIFGPMWITPEIVLPVPGGPVDSRNRQRGSKHPEGSGKQIR